MYWPSDVVIRVIVGLKLNSCICHPCMQGQAEDDSTHNFQAHYEIFSSTFPNLEFSACHKINNVMIDVQRPA